jgi:hypothetical protein
VPKSFFDLLILASFVDSCSNFPFSPAGSVVVRQVVPTERSGFRFVVCKSELTGPCAKLTFQLVFYGICFSPKQYSGRCFCFLSRLIPPEQRHRLGDWPLCPRAKTFPRFSQPGAGQVLASDPFPGLVLQLPRFWCAHRNAPFPVASPFPRRFLPSSRFLFGVRLHGPRHQVASCRSICSQVAATAPRFCFPAHFLARGKEPSTSGVRHRFPSA